MDNAEKFFTAGNYEGLLHYAKGLEFALSQLCKHGPQGPKGEKGDTGPQGPAGLSR